MQEAIYNHADIFAFQIVLQATYFTSLKKLTFASSILLLAANIVELVLGFDQASLDIENGLLFLLDFGLNLKFKV